MNLKCILFLLFLVLTSFAQHSQYHFLDWQWDNNMPKLNLTDTCTLEYEFSIDRYSENFEITIGDALYVECDANEVMFLQSKDIYSKVQMDYVYGNEKKRLKIVGQLLPFRLKDGIYEKLVFCKINVQLKDDLMNEKSISDIVEHSVLSSGKWHKIAVDENGIHRITYEDFVNLGIDVNAINPKNIRIYGQSGGMLPLSIDSERVQDLKELSIQVIGQNDLSFDPGDYVIFYGQSPHQWTLQSSLFSYQEHYYDDFTYYFITTDLGPGLRIQSLEQHTFPDTLINTFDDYRIHENNDVNFVKSGREWYGDAYDLVNSRSIDFSIPNLIGSISLKAGLAARVTSPYNSTFTISSSGLSPQSYAISPVSGNYNYANVLTVENSFAPSVDNFSINVGFNSNSSVANGWIDFIQINAQRSLKMHGSQMNFRSVASVQPNFVSQFELSNSNSNVAIWDVTYPLNHNV